ncbi:hypothetical protein JOL79_17910 [Microbispora sp. RL4-1S]|uniref:Uncharacterized protein n=1 Tax=Microbispora oryzae TaxID=2806554 RepID=A0A940WMF6_9ACTN|nr:hypothetical protein [Microbispora oryzae]MBP2705693.1 hypothetical protein [Microbispora oryzae]
MPGLPKCTPVRRIVCLLILTVLLSSCTGEDRPTAPQAGQTLKNHILSLLKERGARNITVTDPGGRNVPCADGKAKQTFAATGFDVARTTSRETIRSMLLGALDRVAPYKIVNPGPMAAAIHVVNAAAHTKLVLDAPKDGFYLVSGTTDCLAP